MLIRKLAPLTLLAAAFIPGLAAARPAPPGPDCPNEQASNVPSKEVQSAKYRRCGVGLQLFGLDISLFGKKCPRWIDTYPSHQECQGEELIGHACVFDELVEVTREICDCADATLILDTGIALPYCDCDYGGISGYIETFTSQPCKKKGN